MTNGIERFFEVQEEHPTATLIVNVIIYTIKEIYKTVTVEWPFLNPD